MNHQHTSGGPPSPSFLITMLFIITLACIATAVSGCAVVPHNQCDEVYFSVEEVRKCEIRAIRREDHRVQREKLAKQREQCKIPNVWNMGQRRCITRDMQLP